MISIEVFSPFSKSIFKCFHFHLLSSETYHAIRKKRKKNTALINNTNSFTLWIRSQMDRGQRFSFRRRNVVSVKYVRNRIAQQTVNSRLLCWRIRTSLNIVKETSLELPSLTAKNVRVTWISISLIMCKRYSLIRRRMQWWLILVIYICLFGCGESHVFNFATS